MALFRQILFLFFSMIIFGCALAPQKKQVPTQVLDNQIVLQKERLYSEKLEKEKTELELQNAILLKALTERKKAVIQLPKGQAVQQFPQFEELIFDQAKTAYKEKDLPRLSEAVRILKTNQPRSQYLESMYFWLAYLLQQEQKNAEALVVYDTFIKSFPDSQYVPQALYFKGSIYEKLNLKPQALQIYTHLQRQFPNSREKHLVEAKLKDKDQRKSE